MLKDPFNRFICSIKQPCDFRMFYLPLLQNASVLMNLDTFKVKNVYILVILALKSNF